MANLKNKDLKNHILYGISLLSIIITPFIAIYLFEKGWWMAICYILYIAVLIFYLMMVSIILGAKIPRNPHNYAIIKASFVATMNIPIALMSPFPLYMYFVDFLDRYNHTFGTHFYITYEGGILSIFMVSAISVLFIYILLASFAKLFELASDKKQTIIGIFIVFLLTIIPSTGVYYKLQTYRVLTSTEQWNLYQTQEEYEDKQFIDDYNSWRDKQIYQAVQNAKKQQENY